MKKARIRTTRSFAPVMTLGLVLGLAVAGTSASDTLEGPSHVVTAADGSFSYTAVFSAGGGRDAAGRLGGPTAERTPTTTTGSPTPFAWSPPLDPGEQIVVPIEGSLIDPTQPGSVTVHFWDCSANELTLETMILPFGTIQITDNDTDDLQPRHLRLELVWQGYDGSEPEIYLWDGATTTQLTNNSTYDQGPDVSGSTVVWYGCDGGVGSSCDGGDWEIYLWDGATTTQLSDNRH